MTSLQIDALPVNDKVLHFVAFFLLTVVFYWIVDTTRRRTLNLTLAVCTAVLGVGSELLQAVLPNGRSFDAYDVVANIVGSLAAVGLCSWYHNRMLERKRAKRGYGAVPGEEGEEEDLELGEGVGVGAAAASAEDDTAVRVDGTGHEEGVLPAASGGVGTTPAPVLPATTADPAKAAPLPPVTRTLEEEVDNWDENAEDAWDDDDGDLGDLGAGAGSSAGKGKGPAGPNGAGKKRTD